MYDRRVYDPEGELLGSVIGVYDDAAAGRPAWIAVGMGAFSLRSAVVPLAGASMWGRDLIVAHRRRTVLAAPPVDVVVSLEPDDQARLVEHYGPRPTGSTSSHSPTESTS